MSSPHGKQFRDDSIDGSRLSSTGFRTLGFTGLNGAGSITLTGAIAGDRVMGILRTDGATADPRSLFASEITTNDTLEQISSSDLSAQRFIIFLFAEPV